MFSKLVTLVLALPLVTALTINSIQGGTSGGSVTISWTATTTDPSYFSIELQNPSFNNQYAIASNVQTALGTITLTLPQVPTGGDYQLVAIVVNDVNQILSTSGTFSIGAATSSSGSALSTSSVASSISSGTVSTPSASTTSPVSSVSIPVSSAATTPASSGTSTTASSSPSSFSSNGAAAAFKVPGMVPAAAVVLSAVAGAAMVF